MLSFTSQTNLHKKYGVSRNIFSLGYQELQKFNLVERFVNFDVKDPKTNDYVFNDFYDMQDFEVKRMKLMHKTDEKVFHMAYDTAKKLNEPYDMEVIGKFIDAINTYGLEKFKTTARHITKKSKLSPYRNSEFLLTMLRDGLEK